MRRAVSAGCLRLLGLSQALDSICLEIVEALENSAQGRLGPKQLKLLVKNLDPKWTDKPVDDMPDDCIKRMRGMSKVEVAHYIQYLYDEEWIRMYHQIKGLAPVESTIDPSLPGIFKVTYSGGVRYRCSANSEDTSEGIAEPEDRVSMTRFQHDSNGREFGYVQENKLWLPTHLNDGCALLDRIGDIPFESSFEQSVFETEQFSRQSSMERFGDEDSAYTDECSIMNSTECDSPTPFAMSIEIVCVSPD